jgi:hypothetical protein
MPRRRTALFFVVASARLEAPTPAHDGHDHRPKPVPDAELHRPTALPDRVIRTFPDDPERSITVSWRTETSVDKAVAQIAPADAGPRLAARAKTLAARTTSLKSNLGEAHYHSDVLDDLAPSMMYAHRVGDGVNWSEWIHARTASGKPESFSFIYVGDAQNDIKSLWSRVIRGAYSGAPTSRFIVHAGDLVNKTNDERRAEANRGRVEEMLALIRIGRIVVPGGPSRGRSSSRTATWSGSPRRSHRSPRRPRLATWSPPTMSPCRKAPRK